MATIEDPYILLQSVIEACGSDIPYALCGGLCFSILCEPRETKDVDIITDEKHIARLQSRLKAQFPTVVLAFQSVSFSAHHALSRLTVIDNGLNIVDLIHLNNKKFLANLFSRIIVIDYEGVKLNVLSPEDFILVKSLSKRLKDLGDIETLLDSGKIELDLSLVADEFTRYYTGRVEPIVEDFFQRRILLNIKR